MAKVTLPIVGATTGQAGGMVFGTWKDKKVMRARPSSYTPSQSVIAVAQRNKMKTIMELMKFIISFIRVSFKEVSKSITECNAFVKRNVSLVDDNTGWFNTSNYQDLKFSAGTLRPVTSAVMSFSQNSFMISTKSNDVVTPEDNALDVMNLVIVNETQHAIRSNATMHTRASQGAGGGYIQCEFGDILYVYVMYISPDGKKAAETTYLGTYTVA